MSVLKNRIQDIAAELSFQQGYRSTGINQIVAEIAAVTGLIYDHFPSKSDLITVYLRNASDGYFAALHLYLPKAKSPKEKLFSIFDFHSEQRRNHDFGELNLFRINKEIQKSQIRVFELINEHKTKLYYFLKNIVDEINDMEIERARLIADAIYLLLEGATIDPAVQIEADFFSSAKKIIDIII